MMRRHVGYYVNREVYNRYWERRRLWRIECRRLLRSVHWSGFTH